jgi:ribosomal protein S18 acetylase RimI-like enzyme
MPSMTTGAGTHRIDVTIRDADLTDAAHGASLVAIIDSYARGAGGQGAPLEDEARATMVRGLGAHPSAFALLAFVADHAVGAAVCVWTYSTFAARPALNVHDLAVLPDFQGRGVGRALLAEVEARARARGCCKLTLEVHDTNERAKRLYRQIGFGPWDVPTLFVTKPLVDSRPR